MRAHRPVWALSRWAGGTDRQLSVTDSPGEEEWGGERREGAVGGTGTGRWWENVM